MYEPMPLVPPVTATTTGGPDGRVDRAVRIVLRSGIVVDVPFYLILWKLRLSAAVDLYLKLFQDHPGSVMVYDVRLGQGGRVAPSVGCVLLKSDRMQWAKLL
jgi:hypothetical protein